MKGEKTRSLAGFFARYTALVFLVMLGALLLAGALYTLASRAGAIGPSPYSQRELDKFATYIERDDTLNARNLAASAVFGVFSGEGQFIYGNANAAARESLWDYALHPEAYPEVQGIVVRRDAEVRVVFVGRRMAFRNEWLRSRFPNPELFLYPAAILFSLIGLFLLSVLHGRKLAAELQALKEATQKIQEQDLDFTVGRSPIREVNDVLRSMDQMKSALQEALLTQWQVEQARVEQTHALIHDIQTPLTVILGNAELLAQGAAPEQAGEYGLYVMKNALLLRDCVAALKDVQPGGTPPFSQRVFDIPLLWGEVEILLRSMCVAKQIRPVLEGTALEISLEGDLHALKRAFQNVLSNAVHYTPERGTILLRLEQAGGYACFTVRDSGPGFSEDALRFATVKAYSEKEEPSAHGMGLYTADAVIRRHNGRLSIANDPEGGGVVTLWLSVAGHAAAAPSL